MRVPPGAGSAATAAASPLTLLPTAVSRLSACLACLLSRMLVTPQSVTGNPETLEMNTGWQGSAPISLSRTLNLPTHTLGTQVTAVSAPQAALPVHGSFSPVHCAFSLEVAAAQVRPSTPASPLPLTSVSWTGLLHQQKHEWQVRSCNTSH